jgi:hypothetical protein
LPLIGFSIVAPYIARWIFKGTPEFDCEHALRRTLIARYQLPKLDSDRLILIRVAGDEASASLAVAQFVSRLSSIAAGIPSRFGCVQ